jgi:hypothetical protein
MSFCNGHPQNFRADVNAEGSLENLGFRMSPMKNCKG